MSIERSIVAQARPHMLAARAQAIFQGEVSKGCRPEIWPHPVALEPPYCPISRAPEQLTGQIQAEYTSEPTPKVSELIRLQVWPSPEEKFNWVNPELFLKQISILSHGVAFEITGNNNKIQIQFLLHQRDLPILQTAFNGQFGQCELASMSEKAFAYLDPESWTDIAFLDCFPSPPYSHRLTRPDELKITTYRSLVAGLMEIKPPALGFYQAVLQPVKPEHDWHRNVQTLLDMEYAIKLLSGIQAPQRYLQQAPSGDLRQMAWEVETKAHNDKPFYCVAVRLGVASAGEEGLVYLRALTTFLSLFQHGGRPLNFVTEKAYKKVIPGDKIPEMFTLGITYRPGFLVNSAELTGFVHVPPANILECRQRALAVLKTLPVKNPSLSAGTPIGTCEHAGTEHQVCIPLESRSRSTHVIGRPGFVKSTTMARVILDDIDKGMGVAVLDPHGDLVETLLCLIREEHVERTIYFDPGHPDYVPIWNPLKKSRGQDLSRTADDLVAAIKSVVTGWGDRLEHLLRHGLYALLQIPDSTLLDLSDLLRRKSDESERLRKAILEIVDNESAYQFWRRDFQRYPNEAFDPPQHKLSKLLVSGTVSLMLSQNQSLIDLRSIMDEGKILLVNLSTIGPEARKILGCFMLSLLHLTALARSDTPIEDRRQFHIHADEAHRFLTEALEDLLAEARKFHVSLTLAHHFLSQFGPKKVDAISSVGSTIIMNVDRKDAQHLSKDLQGLVHPNDLITLEKGEAIARIDTDIVRVRLPGPLQIPERHSRDAIIKRSFELYYRPVHFVRELIRRRDRRWDLPFSPLTTLVKGEHEEFTYDEF
jgi:hypothetical protein